MNALAVLQVYFIIYQLVSLELGIYLAIKLPYLSYSAVEENLGQIADCNSYFRPFGVSMIRYTQILHFIQRVWGLRNFNGKIGQKLEYFCWELSFRVY